METLKFFIDPTWTASLLAATNFNEFTQDSTPGSRSRNAHAFIIPLILFYACRLIVPSQFRLGGKWRAWFAWFVLSGTLAHRYRIEIFYIHAVLAHEALLALFWLLPLVEKDAFVGTRAKMSRNWTLVQGAWYMVSATAIVQSVVWAYGGGVFDLALTFPLWLHLCGLRKAMYWMFYLENEAVWYVKDLARGIVRFVKTLFTGEFDQLDVKGE